MISRLRRSTTYPCPSSPARLFSYLLLAAISYWIPGDLHAAELEKPPILQASDILPADILTGEGYQIQDEVRSDGFLHYYTIDSDFGSFIATGDIMVAVRVQEIGALKELSKLSKVEVFADSALDAALRPVDTIKTFVEKPKETLEGIPDGIGRMFNRVKRGAEDAKETWDDKKEEKAAKEAAETEQGSSVEEEGGGFDTEQAQDLATKYAKKYFGSSRAERKWAAQLGVDPYSTNEVLQKAIKEVAKVDAAGSFGMKFVSIPRIPGVSYIADINDLVWSKDPGELREHNENLLTAMGVSEDLADRFFDNAFFASPTRQTRFVASLAVLDGAADREQAVELAANADSPEGAYFQVGAAALLGWYHKNQAPITRLIASTSVPVGLTASGTLVLAAPSDQLFWSEDVASGAQRLATLASRVGAETIELWTKGKVTNRCREELETMGWKVESEIDLGES